MASWPGRLGAGRWYGAGRPRPARTQRAPPLQPGHAPGDLGRYCPYDAGRLRPPSRLRPRARPCRQPDVRASDSERGRCQRPARRTQLRGPGDDLTGRLGSRPSPESLRGGAAGDSVYRAVRRQQFARDLRQGSRPAGTGALPDSATRRRRKASWTQRSWCRTAGSLSRHPRAACRWSCWSSCRR